MPMTRSVAHYVGMEYMLRATILVKALIPKNGPVEVYKVKDRWGAFTTNFWPFPACFPRPMGPKNAAGLQCSTLELICRDDLLPGYSFTDSTTGGPPDEVFNWLWCSDDHVRLWPSRLDALFESIEFYNSWYHIFDEINGLLLYDTCARLAHDEFGDYVLQPLTKVEVVGTGTDTKLLYTGSDGEVYEFMGGFKLWDTPWHSPRLPDFSLSLTGAPIYRRPIFTGELNAQQG